MSLEFLAKEVYYNPEAEISLFLTLTEYQPMAIKRTLSTLYIWPHLRNSIVLDLCHSTFGLMLKA